MAIDPRKKIEELPEHIQMLIRGELPEKVPHWLKVDPSHPAYNTVVEWEEEPVKPEPELTKRERYERGMTDDE